MRLKHLLWCLAGSTRFVMAFVAAPRTFPACDRPRPCKGSVVMHDSGSPVGRQEAIAAGLAFLSGAALLAKGESDETSLKRTLFEYVRGDGDITNILEVGIGGASNLGGFTNLDFYRPGQRIVGLDPALGPGSPDLAQAQQRASRLGLELSGVQGEAERLPFGPGTFDAVVATLVFCSVRDPRQALAEVARVLRPGGRFLFVEHIYAPEEGWGLLGLRRQQEVLDPLQQALAGGCHLTRATDELISGAVSPDGVGSGGSSQGTALFSQLLRLERCRINSRWPASEQVLGVAAK